MALREVLRRLTIGLFLLLITIPVFLETIGNLSHKSYLAALLSALILFSFLMLVRKRITGLRMKVNGSNPLSVCLVLSIFCLIVNGLFACCFQPIQAADYRTFFHVARDLSEGIHPGMKDYVAMFPHILGYSAFLSIFLRLFGESIAVAAALNVVLTTISGIIIFILGRKMTDTYCGAAAFLIWSVCPSKLLYNTMVLSEPYYTCLLLLFFLVTERIIDLMKQNKPNRTAGILLLSALSAVILVLVQTARPIAIIPILALAGWVLFLSDAAFLRRTWKRWILSGTVLVFCYAGGNQLWQAYATEQLEQTPPSIPGYSIYVGFNLDTSGSYADEDMALLQDRYFGEYEKNAEAAQRSMFEDAKERIISTRKEIPQMMLTKLQTLLGHDEGGAFYAIESLSERQYRISCIISNVWYYCVWIFAIMGTAGLWKRRENGLILCILLFVIGLILAQLLVEVAARYHYAVIPMLLLVSVYAFGRSKDSKAVRCDDPCA